MKTTESHAVLLLPAHQQHTRSSVLCALGYICRCVVAFVCAYGFSRFVFDSMNAELRPGLVFYTCAAVCTLFALMQKSGKLFISGSVLFTAALVYVMNMCGGFKNTFWGAYTAFRNAWLIRLRELGFSVMSNGITDIDSVTERLIPSEHEMLCLAAIFLSFLISAMFILLVAGRTSLLPIIFTVTLTSSFIFYFGMCEEPFGFSLMLAGFCGCTALARYDAIFVKRKPVCLALGTTGQSRSASREIDHTLRVNSALGGFSGITASLLAAAIIVIPAGFTEPMPDIPSVSEQIASAENRIITFVGGYSPYETALFAARSHVSAPRDTSATERVHSGKTQYIIETDTNIPIYLRSWVGLNYRNDSWSIGPDDRTDEYREKFGSGFSPELLTAELIDAIDPSLTKKAAGSSTAAIPELGFTLSDVHISATASHGNSLTLPAYTDPRAGLLKYGTDESHRIGYVNYYEGIFVTSSVLAPKKYSVTAYLPHTPDEYSVIGMAQLVRHYDEQVSLITPLRRLVAEGADDSRLRSTYEQLVDELSFSHYLSSVFSSHSSTSAVISVPSSEFHLTYSDRGVYTPPLKENTLAYRYVYEMSHEERMRIHAIIDNVPLYDEYVKDNYLGSCESYTKFINLMYDEIARNAGLNYDTESFTFLDIHKAVEAVIDYLSANMHYTLAPVAPDPNRGYYNAAESFLFDTGEGYCVQYATAAAMLLRAMDIPTRYAEGYVVTDFEKSTDKNAPGKYTAVVPDSNAHAWIEVYYEGFGWVQYEVTAPFTEAQSSPSYRDVQDNRKPDDETSAPEHTDTTDIVEETAEAATDDDTTEVSTTEGTAVTPHPSDTSPSDGNSPDNDDSFGAVRKSAAVIAVSLAAVVLALTAAVLIFLRSRGIERERQRVALIKEAFSADMTAERALRCAAKLNDSIMRILAYLKLEPLAGEQASSFAARVDNTLNNISDISFIQVMSTLQAGEFADSVTSAQLKLAAEYYDDLYRFVMSNSGRIKSIYVKYFLLVS